MNVTKIECPSCQQPIEFDPPTPPPQKTSGVIILGVIILAAIAVILVWPLSYDYDDMVMDSSPSVTNHWLIDVSDRRGHSSNEVMSLTGPMGAVAAAERYGWSPVAFISTNEAIVRRTRLPWRQDYFYILDDRDYSKKTEEPARWEYQTISGYDSDGFGLFFSILTNEIPRYQKNAYDTVSSDAHVQLPEATILDYMGDDGWELVSIRPVKDYTIWAFKRLRK